MTSSGVVPSVPAPVALGMAVPLFTLMSELLKRLPALPDEMIWPLLFRPVNPTSPGMGVVGADVGR